jgi:catalase
VKRSASLSLLARPGDGGIRTRKVAVLVADGVDGRSVAQVQGALRAAGAVPRLVGVRIGPFRTSTGDEMQADASMENEPAVLFDALVLPDGAAGVRALQKVGQTLEFVKDTYRHCKAILAIGESRALLQAAGTPMSLPGGEADPGIVLGHVKSISRDVQGFIKAVARHRHPERDTDPPRV